MSLNSPLRLNINNGLSILLGLPRIGSWNTKGRPKKPKTGTLGFNFETKYLEYWDGSMWLGAALHKLR